ncbi:MAG: cell division protein FtsB [Formivibrio sp.]|nr:cell division protein FtsB [Formivibrio sp.]
MRLLAIIFAVLIAALQWPLWVGKGGWLRVWQLDQQVAESKANNGKLQERNDALEAEVSDLKTGTDAIEERARNELGMVKSDEIFFQILDKHKPSISSSINASQADASAPGVASQVNDVSAASR